MRSGGPTDVSLCTHIRPLSSLFPGHRNFAGHVVYETFLTSLNSALQLMLWGYFFVYFMACGYDGGGCVDVQPNPTVVPMVVVAVQFPLY